MIWTTEYKLQAIGDGEFELLRGLGDGHDAVDHRLHTRHVGVLKLAGLL